MWTMFWSRTRNTWHLADEGQRQQKVKDDLDVWSPGSWRAKNHSQNRKKSRSGREDDGLSRPQSPLAYDPFIILKSLQEEIHQETSLRLPEEGTLNLLPLWGEKGVARGCRTQTNLLQDWQAVIWHLGKNIIERSMNYLAKGCYVLAFYFQEIFAGFTVTITKQWIPCTKFMFYNFYGWFYAHLNVFTIIIDFCFLLVEPMWKHIGWQLRDKHHWAQQAQVGMVSSAPRAWGGASGKCQALFLIPFTELERGILGSLVWRSSWT